MHEGAPSVLLHTRDFVPNRASPRRSRWGRRSGAWDMFPLFQQKICGILEFGIFFFLEFLLKSVTPKTKSCELSSTLFYCRDLRFFLLVLLCTLYGDRYRVHYCTTQPCWGSSRAALTILYTGSILDTVLYWNIILIYRNINIPVRYINIKYIKVTTKWV